MTFAPADCGRRSLNLWHEDPIPYLEQIVSVLYSTDEPDDKFCGRVRRVRIVAMCALGLALTGCTETPTDLPPCVDPNGPPCPPYDAGADGAQVLDAQRDAGPADVVLGP